MQRGQVIERQIALLNLLANGATFREASTQLKIAYSTVTLDLRDISNRLGAKNLPHAVYLGLQAGLINCAIGKLKRVQCRYCEGLFWAQRSTAIYCSYACRDKDKYENFKILRDKSKPKPQSGVPGVIWREDRQAWWVWKSMNGKNKYLGSFKTLEDAIALRKAVDEAK